MHWRHPEDKKQNILLHQYCDCLQSGHLNKIIGNWRAHADNGFEARKEIAV